MTVTVTDNGTGNLTDSETFTITVNDVNVAPVLAGIGNQAVNEGATLTFTATATDADVPAQTLSVFTRRRVTRPGHEHRCQHRRLLLDADGRPGSAWHLQVTVTVTDNGTGA